MDCRLHRGAVCCNPSLAGHAQVAAPAQTIAGKPIMLQCKSNMWDFEITICRWPTTGHGARGGWPCQLRLSILLVCWLWHSCPQTQARRHMPGYVLIKLFSIPAA
jgi:hypothetical protein